MTVAPIPAQRTLASAIQIGAPVSARRALRALEALDGVVEQATEQELADAAARGGSRRALHLPAHRRRARRAREARGARARSAAGERVVVISTAHGLKFSDFKVGYHDGTLPGIASPLREPRSQAAGDARRGPGRDCRPLRTGVETARMDDRPRP